MTTVYGVTAHGAFVQVYDYFRSKQVDWPHPARQVYIIIIKDVVGSMLSVFLFPCPACSRRLCRMQLRHLNGSQLGY